MLLEKMKREFCDNMKEERRWKKLQWMAVCLVCLLLVSLYQNNKAVKLRNTIDGLMLQEAVSSKVQNVSERKKVYLTFDDGPSRYTEEILEILRKENVKATFFVIGYEGDIYAERYRKIVEEGHTLAMHAYDHDYKKIYRSVEDFSHDLEKLQDLLERETGVKPTIYRFPGGSSNCVVKSSVKQFIHYLNEKGITYYDWNALSEDAMNKNLTPAQLNKNIMKDLPKKDPCIVLMHDLGDRHGTVDALEPLIKKLKAMNCEILPITEATPAIQHVKNEEK